MGFRFRKSIKVGCARVNFSKSGVGYSVGTKGARITRTANGRTRITASVPGTGISYVKGSGRGKTTSVYQQETKPSMALGVFWRVLAIPFVLLGLLLALAVQPVFWSVVVLGVIEWIYGGSKIKEAKEWEKELRLSK